VRAPAPGPYLRRLARGTAGLLTTGGVSSGPTEAINLLIKRIKRVGFGFGNFRNYRLRLLHCGVDWHTQSPPQSEAAHHA
jgi:Transposase